MCSKRGLVENTDQQTFIMALPRKLRQKYEQVLLPAQLEVKISSIVFGLAQDKAYFSVKKN